ncbi:MAG: cytochrome-c peroxidase [Methylococcales bacterium]
MHKYKLGYLAVLSVLLLPACSSDDAVDTTAALDSGLSAKITDLGLTGDPTTGRTLPAITDTKSQLGMKLFFSKGLGGDQDSACVTCHHPTLGGGDNLSLSIGVEAVTPDLLGPGRRHIQTGHAFDGGPTVPRNAPTTFNVALWDSVLFHDGRVESVVKEAGGNGAITGGALNIRTPDSAFGVVDATAGDNLTTAQARFPVTSPEEMRGHTYAAGDNTTLRDALVARLDGSSIAGVDVMPLNGWQAEFDAIYGTGSPSITFGNIAEAIGEYERSQVFVNNSWKAYVEGDTAAISEGAKEGALLFFNSVADGGANCAECHSGDFFTDEDFYATAMPQIGRGKGDGVDGTDDLGRFRETGDVNDEYAFRTPSLLNVEMYGPWGHAGGHTTLEATVKYHANPTAGIQSYDFNQLEGSVQATNMVANTQLALDKLTANRADVNFPEVTLEDVDLTDEQVGKIVMFLKALTDPCTKDASCLAQWVPNAGDSNPDGLRVLAVDNNGNEL